MVDEEDMEALGAAQLYDAADCAQLLTHTTTVEKTHRPLSRYQPSCSSSQHGLHASVQMCASAVCSCIFALHGQSLKCHSKLATLAFAAIVPESQNQTMQDLMCI